MQWEPRNKSQAVAGIIGSHDWLMNAHLLTRYLAEIYSTLANCYQPI